MVKTTFDITKNTFTCAFLRCFDGAFLYKQICIALYFCDNVRTKKTRQEERDTLVWGFCGVGFLQGSPNSQWLVLTCKAYERVKMEQDEGDISFVVYEIWKYGMNWSQIIFLIVWLDLAGKDDKRAGMAVKFSLKRACSNLSLSIFFNFWHQPDTKERM